MIRFVVFVLLSSFLLGEQIIASPFFDDYVDENTVKKYGQFNCFKKKSCTPGPPKVCGYDMKTRELAEFDDKCTYHKINCAGGFFKIVDMLACESKKTFNDMHNTSLFDWHHINRTEFPVPVKESTTEDYAALRNAENAVKKLGDNTVWQKVMPLFKLVLKTVL